MKRRWKIVIVLGLLLAAFVIYRVSQISYFQANEKRISGNIYAPVTDRAPVMHELGLDQPILKQIFIFDPPVSPQSYAAQDFKKTDSDTLALNIQSNGNPPSSSSENSSDQQIIVRTANLSMAVDDISKTIAQITSLTNASSGFIVTEDKTGTDISNTGVITLRVPAEQFETVMNALRGMAVKVTAENISAADVSQVYTDLSAKLKNLENTTDQLNEIMKKAVSVTDVLSVQTQITQTEGDIEQTKARIKYLAETSAMSLITINLQQSSLVI